MRSHDLNRLLSPVCQRGIFTANIFFGVITVRLETMKIVRALPRLDIVVGGKS